MSASEDLRFSEENSEGERERLTNMRAMAAELDVLRAQLDFERERRLAAEAISERRAKALEYAQRVLNTIVAEEAAASGETNSSDSAGSPSRFRGNWLRMPPPQ